MLNVKCELHALLIASIFCLLGFATQVKSYFCTLERWSGKGALSIKNAAMSLHVQGIII